MSLLDGIFWIFKWVAFWRQKATQSKMTVTVLTWNSKVRGTPYMVTISNGTSPCFINNNTVVPEAVARTALAVVPLCDEDGLQGRPVLQNILHICVIFCIILYCIYICRISRSWSFHTYIFMYEMIRCRFKRAVSTEWRDYRAKVEKTGFFHSANRAWAAKDLRECR